MHEDDRECKFRKIAALFEKVKVLSLYTQETDPTFKDFIQPIDEVNRAFDHLARALNTKDASRDETYVNKNLDKCLSHLYRAFFDVADWTSFILRERIIKELDGYSHDCIQSVIPEYYQSIRPKLEFLNTSIATVRTKKDIAANDLLHLTIEYEEIINELDGYVQVIVQRKTSLDDYEGRCAKKEAGKRRFTWVVAVIAAIVGAGIAFLLSLLLQ